MTDTPLECIYEELTSIDEKLDDLRTSAERQATALERRPEQNTACRK